MIYFDQAATSRPKPQAVYDAFQSYIQEIGVSPGRGSYTLGVQASRMLYQSRKAVAAHFGLSQSQNVVFTKNSTEAINLFFHSFLRPGDHVLISPWEHNAVLRPLHALKEQGIIEYTVLTTNALSNPSTNLSQFIKPSTRMAAITLASNLTGEIIYSASLGKACRELGLHVFVDASQGGGKQLLCMESDYVDTLAFTGHKDLMALPGVGGLCSAKPLTGPPLLQGGTGIHGEEFQNPKIYPEGYEAGTLNMPAIWALTASIKYLSDYRQKIDAQEQQLLQCLLDGLSEIRRITVYRPNAKRVPTISINVEGTPSSQVVSLLDKRDICVRGGIHCAILAHQTLGTVETGAVRLSLNYTNTIEEVRQVLAVLGGM